MGDQVKAFGLPLPFGSIDYPEAFEWVAYTGVDPANMGSWEGQAYLLAVTAFDKDGSTTRVGALPLPFGDIDLMTPFAVATRGAMTTLYPAATIGRSSRPDDVPANLYVPGRLEPGFNYTVELFSGADPLATGSNTIGIIQLDDPEGELDGLIGLGWDGATLTLYRGDPADYFSGWNVVAQVTAAGLLHDANIKEIQLRDLAWLLDTAPLHGQIYGGTGGMDGDPNLAGFNKPYAIGHFFNATPVPLNAALEIYQLSCSSMQSILAKDGGDALTLDGDDPDYATLAGAAIGDGHFRTCLALGIYRMGGKPVLIATADGIGDADVINGHGTPLTRGQICRRIATGRGLVKLDDVAGLDNASFADLDNKQPGPCGWYWNDGSNASTTKGAALDTMMPGCLGWWFMRLSGQLAVGQCEDPELQTAAYSLSFPAEDAGEVRVFLPSMTDYKPPRQATYIGFQKNFTVLQTNQTAGILDPTTTTILKNATQYAKSLDPWASSSYPTSPIVQVDGAFAFQIDAQAEADRQQALMRVRRARYTLPVALDPAGDFPGRILNLANYGRQGWGSSRNFLCCGMNAQGGVSIELWG